MTFDDYRDAFATIALRREDGVLEARIHTDDGPLQWSRLAHAELAEAFDVIRHDAENEVLILTGTGNTFSGPAVEPGASRRDMGMQTVADWQGVFTEGRRLLTNLLDIEIPVIGVINGPAYRHPELPLLSDVVLAADTALIQDAAHFQGGIVPGDGVHVAFPALMGITRARYFLLTGQTLTAEQAREFGLVNEVLPAGAELARAWEIARTLLEQPPLVRRYTRLLMTAGLKNSMREQLGYGLALEGLAVLDTNPREL
jgi:enoyl-CoA hydratase/carnithine racemase